MKALLKAPSLRAPKLLISSFAYLILILFVLGCKGPSAVSTETSKSPEEFVIAFGSCNRVDQPNLFSFFLVGVQDLKEVLVHPRLPFLKQLRN